MKIRKRDVGKKCLVRYMDAGRVECMIVEILDTGSVRVFEFGNRSCDTVDQKQICEIGDFVMAYTS
jgi:hypothetical protein